VAAEAETIYRQEPRAKGSANRARSGLGRSAQAGRPRPISARFGPDFCRCLNLSTSMGGTHSKVEGDDCHDLEPEGTREDTRHEIYTGSGSRSSYPTSCLE
jgi:hypothetical protein